MNRRRRTACPRLLFALAALAVLFRIATPSGTMVADTGRGAALVICTGHGPMTAVDSPATTPASRSHAGGCEFASQVAHALAAPPLELVGYADWKPFAAARPIVLATTETGLAAPPPPSHAPPRALV